MQTHPAGEPGEGVEEEEEEELEVQQGQQPKQRDLTPLQRERVLYVSSLVQPPGSSQPPGEWCDCKSSDGLPAARLRLPVSPQQAQRKSHRKTLSKGREEPSPSAPFQFEVRSCLSREGMDLATLPLLLFLPRGGF